VVPDSLPRRPRTTNGRARSDQMRDCRSLPGNHTSHRNAIANSAVGLFGYLLVLSDSPAGGGNPARSDLPPRISILLASTLLLGVTLSTAIAVAIADELTRSQIRHVIRTLDSVIITPGPTSAVAANVQWNSRDAECLLSRRHVGDPDFGYLWPPQDELNRSVLLSAEARDNVLCRALRTPSTQQPGSWLRTDLLAVWLLCVAGAAAAFSGVGIASVIAGSFRSRPRLGRRTQVLWAVGLMAAPLIAVPGVFYVQFERGTVQALLNRPAPPLLESSFAIFVVSTIWTTWVAWGHVRLSSIRNRFGRGCAACGYPRAYRASMCSECGNTATAAAIVRQRLGWWRAVQLRVAMLTAVVAIVVVIALAIVMPLELECVWRWITLRPINYDPISRSCY